MQTKIYKNITEIKIDDNFYTFTNIIAEGNNKKLEMVSDASLNETNIFFNVYSENTIILATCLLSRAIEQYNALD